MLSVIMMSARKSYKYPSVRKADLYTARRLANAYTKRNRVAGGYSGKELRYVDADVNQTISTDLSSSARADPTVEGCLNGIGQGVGNQQRGGLRATLTSIQIKGFIKWGIAPFQGVVRLYLVLDTQTNSAQMTVSDYLQLGPSGASLQVVNSFHNLENAHRFKTLASKTITMKAYQDVWNGTAITGNTKCQPFEMRANLKGMKMRFTATGGTVASISDNSIHMIAIATNGSEEINYTSRVRFYAD